MLDVKRSPDRAWKKDVSLSEVRGPARSAPGVKSVKKLLRDISLHDKAILKYIAHGKRCVIQAKSVVP